MKKLILALTLSLVATNAHALSCSLTKQVSTSHGEETRTLFTGEVLKNGAKAQVVVVQRDGRIQDSFDFMAVRDINAWNTLDKAVFAMFSISDDGKVLVLGLGHVDMSKHENVLPISAMAYGTPSSQYIGVTDFQSKLSLSCY